MVTEELYEVRTLRNRNPGETLTAEGIRFREIVTNKLRRLFANASVNHYSLRDLSQIVQDVTRDLEAEHCLRNGMNARKERRQYVPTQPTKTSTS